MTQSTSPPYNATDLQAIAGPIAVDGPAASGKGTIAKRLAQILNFDYLDTGALYRAVALVMHERGLDVHNQEDACQVAQQLDMKRLSQAETQKAIRRPEIGAAASIVAAIPTVRSAILDAQRHFAENAQNGAILDGRDIGTVVCPQAPHKLFITARAEIRAERRWKELASQDANSSGQIDFDTVLTDIKERDARDMNRATAPLRQAEDAHLLDTSDLSIEEAVNAALALLLVRPEI